MDLVKPFWNSVLWSDEAKINLNVHKNRKNVWRSEGDSLSCNKKYRSSFYHFPVLDKFGAKKTDCNFPDTILFICFFS